MGSHSPILLYILHTLLAISGLLSSLHKPETHVQFLCFLPTSLTGNFEMSTMPSLSNASL